MNSNIQVNFEKSGGTKSLQYTLDSGCIEQNVTFTAQSTYDWITFTNSNNVVTFTTQAQAESAVDSRTAHYDIYVGGIRCLYTIDITQSGGVPCTCDAFRPSIGSIGPSGATIGDTVGRYDYYSLPPSCQANLITVVATSGDTPYPTFVAENGSIKLASDIEALTPYEDEKTWIVEFRYNGTVCDELYLRQTEIICDCEYISEIIRFTHLVNSLSGNTKLLIASADTACGIFTATCQNASGMLSTHIDGAEYPSFVKVEYSPLTGTSAYVNLLPSSEDRSCAITPLISIRHDGSYVSCTNATVLLEQRGNFISCDSISAETCPEVQERSSTSFIRCNDIFVERVLKNRESGGNMFSKYYCYLTEQTKEDLRFVPRITYAGELETGDYNIQYDGIQGMCGTIENWGTELPDPSIYAEIYIHGTTFHDRIFEGQYTKAVILKIVLDIYIYGEFCKTSTCPFPSLLLIPDESCTFCEKKYYDVSDRCSTSNNETYEAIDEIIYTSDIVNSRNYFCYKALIVTAITADIISDTEHDFTNYVEVKDFVIDSDGGITSYRLVVDENDTDERFQYKITYHFKNKISGEECNEVIARCRFKETNICGVCSNVMGYYLTGVGNKNIGYYDRESWDCEPGWEMEGKNWGIYFSNDVCTDYELYYLFYDKDGVEITTADTEFIGPNNNRLKICDSMSSYVQGRGWEISPYSRGIFCGWWDGSTGASNSVDCSFIYAVRIYNTATNEYCDTSAYTMTTEVVMSCHETTCSHPDCDGNYMPQDFELRLMRGVDVETIGGQDVIMFPAAGGTVEAYWVYNFYNVTVGSNVIPRYEYYSWCDGDFVQMEARSQQGVTVDYGTYSSYSTIKLSLPRTENDNPADYTVDVYFYLYVNNANVCQYKKKTILIRQRGRRENEN